MNCEADACAAAGRWGEAQDRGDIFPQEGGIDGWKRSMGIPI